MSNAPITSIRFSEDEFAQYVELAKQRGIKSPSLCIKSIASAYLTGEIVEASKNADAEFLAKKIAALTSQVEMLVGLITSFQTATKDAIKSLNGEIDSSAKLTYNRMTDLAKIVITMREDAEATKKEVISTMGMMIESMSATDEKTDQIARLLLIAKRNADTANDQVKGN